MITVDCREVEAGFALSADFHLSRMQLFLTQPDNMAIV